MSVENDDGTSGPSRRGFLGMTATAGAFAAMNMVGGQAAAAAHVPVGGKVVSKSNARTTLSPIPCENPKTRVRYRTIDIDGVSVFYREAGDPNAPTILLLHGWPSSSFQYRELMPLLAEKYHVVAPDYPGLGYSGTPSINEYDYGFDNVAKTLLGLTDALRINSYSLYITDFGGCIGWIIARARPERVTAIISQNGAAYDVGVIRADDPEWQAAMELALDPTPERRQAMASALSFDYTKFTYVTGACDLSVVSPDTYNLDFALFQRSGQLDIQVELLISYSLYIMNRLPEAQEYLRQHRPPLLVIWGANDPYYPKGGAEAFRMDVPNAEIHLYDAGHFAIETHLHQIAEHIRDFLHRHV